MATRDWLDGWSPRSARVLAKVEATDVRGALVDTNGDGRELWFGLDARESMGAWTVAVDWDDVGHHQPVERTDDFDVVFAWGAGRSGQRKTIAYGEQTFTVRVQNNGWWLLITSVSA